MQVNKILRIFNNLLFLIKYSWGISKHVFAAGGIEILINTIEPFILLILPKYIIDEIATQKRWDYVIKYIVILIGAMIVIKLFRIIVSVYTSMSVNKCDTKDGLHYASHYLSMDYDKLENSKIRDMQKKVSYEVRANAIIYSGFEPLLTSLFKVIGFSYIIAKLHPLMLVIILLIVVMNYVTNKKNEKYTYDFSEPRAKSDRRFSYILDTMIDFSFAKEVRINNVFNLLTNKFNKELEGYCEEYGKYSARLIRIRIINSLIGFVQMICMYGYVAYMAIIRSITIGSFSVYIGAIYSFSGAFTEMLKSIYHLVYLSKYVDDYKEYKRISRSKYDNNSAVDIPHLNSGIIEFKNVSFKYPNTDRYVLKNISIKIKQGERLSVVGMNGAGKTTFIKLICRLYEPTEGIILYNNVDISKIKYDQYAKELAPVFQDFQLFAFSMADNIILNKEFNKDKLLKALYNSGVGQKLETLPNGIDTSITKEFDENGIEFSGGEGQKLATARAYYKDANVVLLDEPTAALDPISEHEMYKKFDEIADNKIAIYISHRLSSTRFSDKVAVFVDGEIVEYGSHDELMNLDSIYTEMFSKQAQYYTESEVG